MRPPIADCSFISGTWYSGVFVCVALILVRTVVVPSSAGPVDSEVLLFVLRRC